jgi:hypothetical protein
MSEEVTNLTLEVKPIQAYWMLQDRKVMVKSLFPNESL